ncbi:MAG: excinuclease ABC subunit UvrA [Bacteroidia bacterium]
METAPANQVEEKVEGGIIEIFGAREHNLKDIDLVLPRNKLIVFTGLSGSGKSSLAFDTIYAEGQRRYMESFSAYARQFIGSMKRPDVEKIDGLSPVISIEQKTVNRSPRSTVGTSTEIYDFLRLLYSKVADAYSITTGKKMVRFSDSEIYDTVVKQFAKRSVYLLSPLVRRRKGHYRELFEQYRKLGYTKARVDGEVITIKPGFQVSRYQIHDIELVIDRVKVDEKSEKRIKASIELALKQGNGSLMVVDSKSDASFNFSKNLMCPDSGISYDEPQPNTFSFNSPYGYCPACKGLGITWSFDVDRIFPDPELSIADGGIAPLGKDVDYWYKHVLKSIAKKFKFKLTDPIKKLSPEAIDAILYGADAEMQIETEFGDYSARFPGLVKTLEKSMGQKSSVFSKSDVAEVAYQTECQACHGYRLKEEALHFKIADMHIGEASSMQIDHFYKWIGKLEKSFEGNRKIIAAEILKEIKTRTSFLLDVGLNYLMLNRSSASISGGEAQRIRLATQIGSQLLNVLYILDEPSIGLHQRDNQRLIGALKNLRDIGNTVLVVEHDRDMIMEADYIVDLGPKAGIHGGEVVAKGSPDKIMEQLSITTDFLSGRANIRMPERRRKGSGKKLRVKGASGHNLKNVTLELPLGMLVCVTGVSGSGKSSLINETLYPILRSHFYNASGRPLPYKSIKGLEHLDKVIEIDQSAIGRTPRSNPATYTGMFTLIRNLFSDLPEAKIRGYKPGRFSFNVKGGRCEECKGGGLKLIEMNFLPDVYVECPSCFGKRYNRETLEVRYKGKSISDVLEMTIEESLEFFRNIPNIKRKLMTLNDVGLGYIHVGQPSTTLSGGEAQRVKLATELSKRDTGQTLYILDEPTTGLHFEDIRILMDVLQKLVTRGNTVLIIEHNMDVIKMADHIIDIGPEGGSKGGEIICSGTPEEVAAQDKGHTAKFLARELK